ncbi:MAG: class I SAM-dependent methyltransferase [bacterium]
MNKTIKCPVCKNGGNKEKFGEYIKCNLCQSLFLGHPPTAKSMQKAFNEYAEVIDTNCTNEASLMLKERLHVLDHYLPKKSNILDVGCGNGLFLELVLKKGHIPTAMDIASQYVERLQKKGIQGYTSMRDIPRKSFDAITAFDVIEHTTNPQKFIRDIKDKLKKNSYIMLTTPNLLGISGRILRQKWWVFGPDGHFTLFSPNSLRIILEDNDFEILYCRTDAFTQWFMPNNTILKKGANKILYTFFSLIRTYAYSHYLGDNIEILAKLRK